MMDSSSHRRRRLGWGAEGTSIDRAPCASCKIAPAVTPSLDCPKCHLVAYCSEKCRSQDASVHKSELCNSRYASSGWEKALDELLPRVARIGEAFCAEVHLWGNTPASSCLNLRMPPVVNHGSNVVNLCFPASGDFRDVVCTVGELPIGFQGKVNVYINDDEPLVMVRNLLMLELMRKNRGNDSEAAECVAALWYSSRMTTEQWNGCFSAALSWLACNAGVDDTMDFTSVPLELLLRDLFTSVRADSTTKGKLWGAFSEITAEFGPEVWRLLEEELKPLQPGSVMVARREVFAKYRGWVGMLQNAPPASRAAWIKFNLEDGLLLPMASNIKQEQELRENQFLLTDGTWTQHPLTSAKDGWNPFDCRKTGQEHGVPVGDEIGALFFHVKQKLRRFMEVVEGGRVHFHLTCMDATDLAKKLKVQPHPIQFHTVATSNISDSDYLGIKKVLRDWGPMLDPEKGTLVTMQMQWFVKGSVVGIGGDDVIVRIHGALGNPKKESVVAALQRNRAFQGNKAKLAWSRASRTEDRLGLRQGARELRSFERCSQARTRVQEGTRVRFTSAVRPKRLGCGCSSV